MKSVNSGLRVPVPTFPSHSQRARPIDMCTLTTCSTAECENLALDRVVAPLAVGDLDRVGPLAASLAHLVANSARSRERNSPSAQTQPRFIAPGRDSSASKRSRQSAERGSSTPVT